MRNLIILFMSCALNIPLAYGSFNPNILKPKTETGAAQTQSQSVDINRADVKALTSLKGVGERKAQAIIAYRTQHGAFKSVNELSAVKGFSEKQVASLLQNNEGRITAKTVS